MTLSYGCDRTALPVTAGEGRRGTYIAGVPVSSLGSDEDWRICNWCILVLHLFILNLVLFLRYRKRRERQASLNVITIIVACLCVYIHACGRCMESENNYVGWSSSQFYVGIELQASGFSCKCFSSSTTAPAQVRVLTLSNSHPSHKSKGKAQRFSFLEHSFCVWVMVSTLGSGQSLTEVAGKGLEVFLS